jgi:phenylacetate-coenzyme A ligase PaaK-like adenylate-forming protein
MPRTSLGVKMRGKLASDPLLSNRVLRLLGPKRVERLGRKNAIRAAQQAFERVPYYRKLYETHGFDANRMRRLDWAGFVSLPMTSKAATVNVEDEDLLDSHLTFPRDDALIGRSSGTTRKPVIWPTGWDEFYLLRAIFEHGLREIGADHKPSAVVLMMGMDGLELAGTMAFRTFFSMKEELRWPFEVFLTGEDTSDVTAIMKWIAKRNLHSLFVVSFPGTFESALNAIAADPQAHDVWTSFKRKKLILGGQLVAKPLRERVAHELALGENDLTSLEVLYISSDSGHAIAHTTPFVGWLQRFLSERPDLYDVLGLDPEHRTKSILEFVPPFSMFIEPNQEGFEGAILTTWKHRPLVRYQSRDLLWVKTSREIIDILNKHAKGWRRDFKRIGYDRRYIPSTSLIGVVLGRADDIRIVNSANISPDILRHALELAGILPQLHHFKHDTDDDEPLTYYVYVELSGQEDEAQLRRLEEEWKPLLLDALTDMPEIASVLLAPFKKVVDLRLFVRSRGTGEFEGDDMLPKRAYVPVRRS